MRQLKIALVLALAIILQTSLAYIWHPFIYIDLPLVVVVYFALQRDPMKALVIGMIAGLATDALSVGLLGAGGFSKTLTAYVVVSVATRIMLDNPLLRIPVLASATLLDSTVYILLHRMLGQPPLMPFATTAGFKVIGTTVAGSLILYVLDTFFSERARQRKLFAGRRRAARRSVGMLRKR
ncbi:MAG: rod shape-determining protein MreD [Pyrinomonadaceae bacterium]